jgi:hypothetical protein
VDCEQAEIEEREPNVMRHGARLTLDNAYNSSFKDEEYRTLVITGYRRGAKLKTASADEVGKNKSFPIYSLKIVSSIDDCSESPALVELATRTIFLRTDSIHSLSKEDLGQFDLNEQLQLDSVNWRGFSDQFNNAWDTQGGPTEQLKRVKHALSVLKKVKFKLSPRQQTLTCTAIASAYAFSGDMTIEEMLNLWGEYWTWVAKRKQSLLASLIKRNFLVDELFSLVSKDEVGMPTDLSCVLLQDYFLRLKKEGQIKKDDDLDLAMSELGYYRKEIGKEARWILRNSVSC